MTTSPTQRTLAWLRKQGYQAAVAEKWNPHAHIRQDLFGWIDIVAYHREEPGIIGVQCTVDGSRASRRSKSTRLADGAWLVDSWRLDLAGDVGEARIAREAKNVESLQGGDNI